MCDSLWEECDDSLFNEICDTEIIVEKKVNANEEAKANEVKPCIVSEIVENTAKRKYCASESNGHSEQTIEERKKLMIKKLKSNSLFKI